jgi:hypothetical protein
MQRTVIFGTTRDSIVLEWPSRLLHSLAKRAGIDRTLDTRGSAAVPLAPELRLRPPFSSSRNTVSPITGSRRVPYSAARCRSSHPGCEGAAHLHLRRDRPPRPTRTSSSIIAKRRIEASGLATCLPAMSGRCHGPAREAHLRRPSSRGRRGRPRAACRGTPSASPRNPTGGRRTDCW